MITIIVLFVSFAILFSLSRLGILFAHKTTQELAVYSMAIFMIFFGVSHFYKQDELILMLPEFIPFQSTIIFVTGIVEIILAIGLIYSPTRRLSGILLVLYLVAVFPANIYKAMNEVDISGTLSSPIMSWVRLAFQPIFIVWTLYGIKKSK